MFPISCLTSATRRMGAETLSLVQKILNMNPDVWFDDPTTYAQSALAFESDGSTTYLISENEGTFAIGDQDFSAWAWVQIDSTRTADTDYLMSEWKTGTNKRSWGIRLSASHKMVFFICDDGTSGNVSTSSHATDLSLAHEDVWIFVVVRYDASADEQSIRLFDTSGDEIGVEKTGTHAGGAYSDGGKFHVSGQGDGSSQNWDGYIDQAAVCVGYRVTDDDITELVNGGNGLQYADLTGSENYYANLEAWYDFNTIQNLGRNYATSQHAVDLPDNTDWFSSTSSDFDKETGAFSVSAWLKTPSSFTGDDGLGIIICSNGTSSIMQWAFRISTVGKPYVHFYDNDNSNYIQRQSSETLSTDTWYHVGFSFNGDATPVYTDIEVYVSSVQTTHAGDTSIGSFIAMESVASFNIGRHEQSGSPADVTGPITIGTLAFYDAELSAANFSTLWNDGVPLKYVDTLQTDLVSHWDFDEGSLNILGQDKHGSNDLTPVSIVAADMVGGVQDARTQYVYLDGANDYLSSTSSNFEFQENSTLTIQAFAQSETNDGSGNYLMGKQDNTANNVGWFIRLNSSEQVRFMIRRTSSVYMEVRTDTSINLLEDTLITVVYDGTDASGVDIYFDGVAQATTTVSDTLDTTTITYATDFMIGWAESGTGASPDLYWDGPIHHVCLFTENLTGDDLTSLLSLTSRNDVLSDYTGSTTNLLAWYDFENSADIGADSHSTNDLTPNSIDRYGPNRKLSYDLLEAALSSSDVVAGHASSMGEDYDGVSQWSDRSGNGLDATQSTYTLLPYISNGAVTFDGVSDEITLSGTADKFNSLHNGTGGTICAYVRPSGAGAANDNIIFDNGGYSSNKTGVRLMITTGDLLSFRVTNTTASPNAVISISTDISSVLDGTTWLKILIDFNTSGSDNTVNLYCNAITDTETDSNYVPDSGDASFNAVIGTTNATTPTDYFEGEMKSVLVFPKVLTSAERTLISDHWDTL